MKLTTYISAGVFIFLSAWVMKNKEANDQSGSLYHTKWTLKRIHADANNSKVTGKAFIHFDHQKKSAGGNGGCNSFGSTLNVTGNKLEITNIFSTEMFCEGIQPSEDTYLKYLGESNRFDIKGKILSLYMDKHLLLEFSAE